MAVLLALIPAAGHDQLWFLLMAQRWLHGATLYGPQIFDSNTPAIVWLSALPVALAEHLSLPVPFTAKLLTVFLELAILLLARSLLRHLPLPAAQRLFLTFAFLLLFAVSPARDLGQRDHLVALLCLPYVLAAAFPPRLSLRLLVVLLAAVAFCLKPQLSLIALTLELFFLLRPVTRPRRLRPEPFLFLLTGTAFLLAIRGFAPLYFSLALPTVLSTYWAIGHLSLLQLIAQAPQLLVLAVAVLALRPTLNPKSPLTPAIDAFLLAGSAALLAYLLQATGWYYQQLPALAFLGLTLAFELVTLTAAHPVPSPAWLVPATACLSLLTLALTFHFSGYPLFLHSFTADRTYAITTPDPAFFSGLPPATPIATLTTSVDDAIMPVFRFHLTWAQRTNNLWTLPALLRAASAPNPHLPPPRLAQLSAQQRQWMVEDLTRWQPRLVLVARCQDPQVHCQQLEDRHDDILAFFLADPTFARIWAHYRPFRASGPYDAYTLVAPW
jgi:hypothetical protein